MVKFADSQICRHKQIALYFGESINPCKNRCDNCINPDRDIIDITQEAKKLLSAIYRTKQSFGIHYIIDILRGSKEQRIIKNGHNNLSVYAIGKEYSKPQWLSISDRLLEVDAVVIGEYRVYNITPKGVSILKGEESVTIRQERITLKKASKKKKKMDYFEDYEVEIFDRLRKLRKEIAIKNKVPPYVIFSDKTLKELSIVLPTDKIAMLDIHGVGEVKFQRYGKEFLKLIRKIKGEQ
jgi:ATP-dependent DNA helicase RecQ